MLSKSAVLLLWTALQESASNVRLCAHARCDAAESCAQRASATAATAAPCWPHEAYPHRSRGETPVSPCCRAQSYSGASFMVFPLPWSLPPSPPIVRGHPTPGLAASWQEKVAGAHLRAKAGQKVRCKDSR